MGIFNNVFRKKNGSTKDTETAGKAFQELLGGMFDGSANTKHFTPKGKFGYEKSNPILTKGVPAGYAYLNSLECANGDSVAYNRIGSMMSDSDQLPHPMDGYTMTNIRTGREICTLYVYGYSHETSAMAPEGFRFK